MENYFVMLNCIDGENIIPLVNSEGVVARFGSLIDATVAGESNLLGQAYGYEIFELGSGEDYSDRYN